MKNSAAAAKFRYLERKYYNPRTITPSDTYPPPSKPVSIAHSLGTPSEQEFSIHSDWEDEQLKDAKAIKEARGGITRLRYIQLGFCMVMLGGYVRLTATGMNIFSPGTLDDAFETDFDINTESVQNAMISFCIGLLKEWPFTVFVVGTALWLAMDIMYYWAITTKDKCELEEKISDLEEAKKDSLPENLYKTQKEAKKIAEILDKTKAITQASLKEQHAKIIEIIEQDILIQELLIRSDIDKQYLLEKLRAEGANANIADIMEKLSIDVTLKDYKSSHKIFQQYARYIEYAQAIKIPLRYTSLLLLLNHRAFDYPDITSWTGVNSFHTNDPVYEWIVVGGILLLALNIYAFHLEFKKNDTITEFDKRTRELKNTHHNALLATTLQALYRKLDEHQGATVKADEKTASAEETFLGIALSKAVFLKLIISAFCLGSLGRRVFTIYGLSGEENASEHTFLMLGCCAALVILADVIYTALSVIEERWDLINRKDRNNVLDATKKHQKDLEGACNAKPLSPDEMVLAKELEKAEVDKKSKFKTEHPTLNIIKLMTDNLLCVKFGLRALSVSWALIEIRATESFKKAHVGDMDAPDATMLFAFTIGFLLGIAAQYLNYQKDKVLKPMNETREYTQNTLLFFRDEKPGQLTRRPPSASRSVA